MNINEVLQPSNATIVRQLNESTAGKFAREQLERIAEAQNSDNWEVINGDDYLAMLENGQW